MLREIQDHFKLVPFFIMVIISQPQPTCLFHEKNIFEPKISGLFSLLGEQGGK